jgi:hypothetical protein
MPEYGIYEILIAEQIGRHKTYSVKMAAVNFVFKIVKYPTFSYLVKSDEKMLKLD